MKKSDAIEFFGGVQKMADALGTTRQSIHRWPDTLEQAQEDRVRGAYMRFAEERDKKAVLVMGQK